jgi:hypothetical protein
MTPVVYHFKGRKQLIRGIPTNLLAWIVYQLGHSASYFRQFRFAGNTSETATALARELLTRECSSRARAAAALLSGSKCPCDRPGLYIVGGDVYCKTCLPAAASRGYRFRQHRATKDDHRIESDIQERCDLERTRPRLYGHHGRHVVK